MAFCEEEANAKKLNRLPIEGGRAPALDTASQTEDIRGGEDRALLERASEQGEETEGGKLKVINSTLMFKSTVLRCDSSNESCG